MTFTFPKGVSALVGLNGSGKSTLLERIKRSKLVCGEWLPTDASRAYMLDGMRAILANKDYERQLPQGGGESQAFYHTHALAFASPGDVLTFDEPENSLHPHGIRQFVTLARERTESVDDLTIVLATHSPVVLDEFRAEPDRVFVLKYGHNPVALDTLHDRRWLAQFSLGDLYTCGKFGGFYEKT